MIARKHMMHTCTSSLASPIFSLLTNLLALVDPIELARLRRRLFGERERPESKLAVLQSFCNCSRLEEIRIIF